MQASSDVSVIICTYLEARWDDLVQAIESLEHQTLAPAEIIICVDHNPTLLQRILVCFPHLMVVENKGARGLSGARNSGMAVARGRKIAFLDDDATAEPAWLALFDQWFDHPAVLGVGGRTEPVWLSRKPRWFPSEFNWVVGCEYREGVAPGTRIRNPFGGNMCVRRRVFENLTFHSSVGRIGAVPLGCEETELCIRAHQRWPLDYFVYEPRAVIHHKIPANRTRVKYFVSRCYGEGLSKAAVSSAVGLGDGLAAERAYTLRALPKGIMNGVRDAVLGRDSAGLARAAAIVLGLSATVAGFVRGSIARSSRPMVVTVKEEGIPVLAADGDPNARTSP